MIVLGFMLRSNNAGITSMVSSLRLKPKQYDNILHFFRSRGYEVSDIYDKWIDVAKAEMPFTRITGYTILLGDHIKIAKEGRRMPDIRILHQDSENSSKGEFIEGHMYGQVSAVITKDEVSRSLPLITERQQSPPRKEGSKEPDGDTLVAQMVKLVGKAVNALGDEDKAVVALDAYFSKAAAFLAADKVTDEHGNRRLEIVTRGRDDSVGYLPPSLRPKGKRGRTPKFGEKVVLGQLFSDMSGFTKTEMKLYGKTTTVTYQCFNLIWKPLKRKVRFVLVDTEGRGRMILMCSDLRMMPEDIITIYCLRFKIETGFDEQKNDIGSFSYHFWTEALEKRKRWAKNQPFHQTAKPERVENARRATDSFVCLGTIAAGISTIIAFCHNRQIWSRYPGWIRTLRSRIPSIAITKVTLAEDFSAFLQTYPQLHICSVINDRLRAGRFLYEDAA